MTLDKYIQEIRNALRYPGAHATYFPSDKQERRSANLKLAREIGFGLKDYPANAVKDAVGGLYGQIIVANSFDSIGVCIDAREWIQAIQSRIHGLASS